MTYPTAIEVDGTAYAINTGYEHALACYACIDDLDISDIDRAFGIMGLIYKEQPRNMNKALTMAVKYLQLGKELQRDPDEEDDRDLDFTKDMHYIRASFRSDYGIDLDEDHSMHWWKFSELLQGLTDSCVLNRVRDLRNLDTSKITDPQQLARIRRAQEEVALTADLSAEDQRKLDEFYAQLK